MSASLRWAPVVSFNDTLPRALMFALREIYGWPVMREFKESDQHSMGVIDTLVAQKVDGAKQLKEAVDQHGSVKLWEES